MTYTMDKVASAYKQAMEKAAILNPLLLKPPAAGTMAAKALGSKLKPVVTGIEAAAKPAAFSAEAAHATQMAGRKAPGGGLIPMGPR